MNLKKFLIVANGCFLTKATIQTIAIDKIIIALDGACANLAAIDIMPHIILGDFDSIDAVSAHIFGIDSTSIAYKGKNDITIVPDKNQNLTDLVKAIRYCDLHAAVQIDIVCAEGGRVDHTLGNFNALRAEYKKHRPIYLHTEIQTINYIKNDVVEICGNIGDHCGILGFPYGRFSSTGLRYDVHDYPIEPGHDSICNQLAANSARIEVVGEALIVIPRSIA